MPLAVGAVAAGTIGAVTTANRAVRTTADVTVDTHTNEPSSPSSLSVSTMTPLSPSLPLPWPLLAGMARLGLPLCREDTCVDVVPCSGTLLAPLALVKGARVFNSSPLLPRRSAARGTKAAPAGALLTPPTVVSGTPRTTAEVLRPLLQSSESSSDDERTRRERSSDEPAAPDARDCGVVVSVNDADVAAPVERRGRTRRRFTVVATLDRRSVLPRPPDAADTALRAGDMMTMMSLSLWLSPPLVAAGDSME